MPSPNRRPEPELGWTDYEEIRQLLSAYCFVVDDALNESRLPNLADFYHPQVVFTTSFDDGVHVGLPAVIAWYEGFLGSRLGYYRWVRHLISEPSITLGADTARSSTYCDARSVDRHGRVRSMAGRYDDLLLKQDGRWLIKERHDSVHFHFTAGTVAAEHC